MILVNVRRSPDTELVAREQQDMLATLAAFGLPLTLLFSGEGLRQLDRDLLPGENLLDMLPGFGITEIYADTASLAQNEFCLSKSRLPCKAVSDMDLKALSQRAQHAVNI